MKGAYSKFEHHAVSVAIAISLVFAAASSAWRAIFARFCAQSFQGEVCEKQL